MHRHALQVQEAAAAALARAQVQQPPSAAELPAVAERDAGAAPQGPSMSLIECMTCPCLCCLCCMRSLDRCGRCTQLVVSSLTQTLALLSAVRPARQCCTADPAASPTVLKASSSSPCAHCTAGTNLPLCTGLDRKERHYRRRGEPEGPQTGPTGPPEGPNGLSTVQQEERAERRARKERKRAKEGRRDKRSHKRRRHSSSHAERWASALVSGVGDWLLAEGSSQCQASSQVNILLAAASWMTGGLQLVRPANLAYANTPRH